MDDETRQTLAALGWAEHLGRDAKGQPYIAFVRRGHYFHVTLDSRRMLKDEPREYAPGRKAKMVEAERIVPPNPFAEDISDDIIK